MTYDLALEPEEEEKPRLYSSGPKERIPVDVVALQHETLHADLIRWGRWQNERSGRPGLLSIESLYSKGGGTPPATAPMGSDPLLMAIERAVISMPKAHRDTIRWIYVYRWTPYTICRAVRPGLRYEAYPAWAHCCRAMVLNLLRRHNRP